MEIALKHAYLELLLGTLHAVEEDLDTMDSYITEENFDQYFNDYLYLNQQISSIKREIKRLSKELGISRKALQNLRTQ